MLTAADAVALYDDTGRRLAHDPIGDEIWDADLLRHADASAVAALTDQRRVLEGDPCGIETPVRALVAQPLLIGTDDDATIGGVLVVATTRRPARHARAIAEVARYGPASWSWPTSTPPGLASTAAPRCSPCGADQSGISSTNALNTIASFVRTDPARARELILDFADFTRYSFRAAGEYTVLADELRNVDRYLTLERARFGPKLTVKVQAAPRCWNVVLPFLALQPLVENAVRHGWQPMAVGLSPSSRATRAPTASSPSRTTGWGWIRSCCVVGTSMRSPVVNPMAGRGTSRRGACGADECGPSAARAFGNDYGLVVDTGIGAGTKVGMQGAQIPGGNPRLNT